MSQTREKLVPRQILQRNLKALLEKHGMTGPEVADKAKVDRKTVNNMLNAKYDPRPEMVDQVARVFGHTCWQLLSPHFKPDHDDKTDDLLHLYGDANEEGKENILRVAEMAAGRKR